MILLGLAGSRGDRRALTRGPETLHRLRTFTMCDEFFTAEEEKQCSHAKEDSLKFCKTRKFRRIRFSKLGT